MESGVRQSGRSNMAQQEARASLSETIVHGAA